MGFVLFLMIFGCVSQSKYERLEKENDELVMQIGDITLELLDCQDKSVSLDFDNCEDATMMALRGKEHYRTGLINKSLFEQVLDKRGLVCQER